MDNDKLIKGGLFRFFCGLIIRGPKGNFAWTYTVDIPNRSVVVKGKTYPIGPDASIWVQHYPSKDSRSEVDLWVRPFMLQSLYTGSQEGADDFALNLSGALCVPIRRCGV